MAVQFYRMWTYHNLPVSTNFCVDKLFLVFTIIISSFLKEKVCLKQKVGKSPFRAEVALGQVVL